MADQIVAEIALEAEGLLKEVAQMGVRGRSDGVEQADARTITELFNLLVLGVRL